MKKKMVLAMAMVMVLGSAAGCGNQQVVSEKEVSRADATAMLTPVPEKKVSEKVSATPTPKTDANKAVQTAAKNNTSGSAKSSSGLKSTAGSSASSGNSYVSSGSSSGNSTGSPVNEKPAALADTPEEGWIPVTIYDDYGNSVEVTRGGDGLWYDENEMNYNLDAAADGSIIYDGNGKQWYWQAPAVTSGEYYGENGEGFYSLYLYDEYGNSVEVFREDGSRDWYDENGTYYGDVENGDSVIYDEYGNAWYFTAG